MKKASKILTLILIVVFVLSVFAGCDLVGRNVAVYRNAQALTVGGEKITVGKLLDTFNTYYNNYYSYISSGYISADQLLRMAISSLIQQYMQIDSYVSDPTSVKYTDITDLQKEIHNAEYLNKDEFAYAVKYVTYLAYNAFDQLTDDNINAKYDLNEAETEDTSRDFTEYDDLTKPDGTAYDSYAEYNFAQNFINEEADDYFENYYPSDKPFSVVDLEGYVYDVNSEFVAKRVEEYNDRLTDDDKKDGKQLTAEEYVNIQKDTVKQYRDTIQSNYGVTLEEFINGQLADMVSSCIIAKWNYNYYKDLENDDLKAKLQSNYETLRRAQIADFNINGNFDSFITSLSSSSTIYNIPEDESDNYVFVKNILIPFTSDQTALLTNLQNQLGSSESDAYIAKRNEFASQIVAQYFDSDKYTETDEGKAFEDKYFAKDKWFEDKKKSDEEDSVWQAKTNVFTANGGDIAINPAGVLGQFFNADGTVATVDGKSKTDTVIELMKRFNTDVGQHTASFDYVVYVGEDWEDYSHSWVKEFYTAVNEDLVGADAKEYTLCVSSYGVHIIFKSGTIADKLFEFNFDKRLDTRDPNYNLFTTYFNSQMSLKTQDALEALEKVKLVDNDYTKYIVINGGFNKFLKDNGFTFDLSEYVEELTAEL